MPILLQPGHGPPDRHRQRQKKELHLCQACAEKQQLVKQQELNLSAILQTVIGQHVGRADRRAGPIDLPGVRHKVHGVQGRGPARLSARLRGVSASAWSRCCSGSIGRPGTSARRRRTPADAARQAELVELRTQLRRGGRGRSLRRGRPAPRPAPTEGSHG